MAERKLITGPTFEEMLHPHLIDPDIRAKANEARTTDPLDSINLFNISWRDINNKIHYVVLPPELTGVETPIVVLYGIAFPDRQPQSRRDLFRADRKRAVRRCRSLEAYAGVALDGQLWHRRRVCGRAHGLQEHRDPARRA